MLDRGEPCPAFQLPDQTGALRSLRELMGRKGLVLYAYPKDNTPGCTLEALEFTAELPAFRRKGYNVVGLSKDSVVAHQKFITCHSLGIPLLSDPEASLLQALGAWGPKTMRGRTSLGILRSTFVFGAEGRLLKAYPRVKAEGHAAQVLADLATL